MRLEQLQPYALSTKAEVNFKEMHKFQCLVNCHHLVCDGLL